MKNILLGEAAADRNRIHLLVLSLDVVDLADQIGILINIGMFERYHLLADRFHKGGIQLSFTEQFIQP